MPSRTVFAAFLFSAGLALAAVRLPAQDARGRETPGRAKEILRLIEQLDSKRYGQREEATRKLMEMEDALPALQRVVKSPASLELRRRAEQILAVFRERQRRREMAAEMAKGKRVAADLLIERLVLLGKAAPEDDWRALTDVARAISVWAGEISGKDPKWFPPISEGDVRRWILSCPLVAAERSGSESTVTRKRIVASGIFKATPAMISDVLVCQGGLVVSDKLLYSLTLINGDLRGSPEQRGELLQSVVFCDGDVVFRNRNVFLTRVEDSVIVATGMVKVNKVKSKGNVILEKARNPLRFLRLFETADVGLEVEKVQGGVQVRHPRPGSPFAAAGVQAGDRLLAVSGAKVDSAEQFRRLLRSKVAARAEVILAVCRGAKALEFRVPLND